MTIMFVVRASLLVLYLLTWTSCVAYQQQQQPEYVLNFTEIMKPTTTSSSGSSFIFPVDGSVYPLGHLTVTIAISNGDRARPYVLDIDTGSDLTWVACVGADPIPSNPYSPKIEDVIRSPSNDPSPYTVEYADGSSSTGYLVRGSFPLQPRDGARIAPRLIFGCGTQNDGQQIGDGLLGLGKGNPGILKQLHEMGVIRSVVAHCFSPRGGGYLFLGDIPVVGIAWKQLDTSDDEHYYLGSADILLSGQATDITGLPIIFDSGSTYTYLNSLAYEALLDLVTRNLNGSPLKLAPDDTNLPVCWGGSRPITSFGEVSEYFKTLALNFTGAQNVLVFEMPPKSYLIISDKGNVCFGILDEALAGGLGGVNVIGDISMFDKLVIYDNENEMVGWGTVNCPTRP